jgi:hypothetical protein
MGRRHSSFSSSLLHTLAYSFHFHIPPDEMNPLFAKSEYLSYKSFSCLYLTTGLRRRRIFE